MKYAIVEDGGKQYKAVEGGTIEVDRFAAEVGEQIDLERVLLVADGDRYPGRQPRWSPAQGAGHGGRRR